MGCEERIVIIFIRVSLAAHEQHVLQVMAEALQGEIPRQPADSGSEGSVG